MFPLNNVPLVFNISAHFLELFHIQYFLSILTFLYLKDFDPFFVKKIPCPSLGHKFVQIFSCSFFNLPLEIQKPQLYLLWLVRLSVCFHILKIFPLIHLGVLCWCMCDCNSGNKRLLKVKSR